MNRNVPNPMARFRAKQTAPLVSPPAAAFAAAPAAPPSPDRPQRRSKRFWVVLGVVAFVALLMSNCAGRATGESALEVEREGVVQELSAARLGQEQAETRVGELEREVRELAPQVSETETLLAALEAERANVETLQQERDVALAAVAELEARIVSLEADAAAAPAPPAPVAQPQPAAQPAPAPTPYYANCSDARAAGAAPLRTSSPGYRSGLDRDGDGVACES